VIQNPHADDPDQRHHFYRVTPCPCLADVRFRIRELSCSQKDRQTDSQNERSHYTASVAE